MLPAGAVESARYAPFDWERPEGFELTNLDEALERFHLTDLEYGGGYANHGPMAAEALESLGHQALIPAFVDLYFPRLPLAEAGDAIADFDSDAALGNLDRAADWVATYEAKLSAGDWRAVLSTSLPGLLPGIFSAAGHGMLRTAHAVRMLERRDSPLRRRELARGLGYWSAGFRVLPGLPGSQAGFAGSVEEAIRSLKLGSASEARGGLLVDSVDALDGSRDFIRAIERIDRPPDDGVESFLESICREAGRLYCAHPEYRIPYVHAMTIPTAIRGLIEYLDSVATPGIKGLAALYAFQVVAAIHAVYGETNSVESSNSPALGNAEVAQCAESWDEIRYRAACSIQEHAIKMAAACYRASQLDPDPIYRLAAADAALRIEGSRSDPIIC